MKRIAVLLCLLASLAPGQGVFNRAVEAHSKRDYATAISVLKPLVEKGDREAQALLGLMMRDGQGMPRDMSGALTLFQEAAGKKSAHAQFRLAEVYFVGMGVVADPAMALDWLRKSAKNRFPDALLALGTLKLSGKSGIEQDRDAGVRMIREAAIAGLLIAQISMAKLHLSGAAGTRDVVRGVRWVASAAARGHKPSLQFLTKSAQEGSVAAKFELGQLNVLGAGVPINLTRGLALVRATAAANHGDASWFLGELHLLGRCGFKKDPVLAKQHFFTAAARESVAGLFRLGWCEWEGVGNPDPKAPKRLGIEKIIRAAGEHYPPAIGWLAAEARRGNIRASEGLVKIYTDDNDERALPMLKHVAAAGSAVAQLQLAALLEESDPAASTGWYVRAAGKGHKPALVALGGRIADGEAVVKNPLVAFRALLEAARAGHVTASYAVGIRYVSGIGVTANPAKALKHFADAAREGHKDATGRLKRGAAAGRTQWQREYGLLIAEDPDGKAEAEQWLRKAADAGDAGAQVGLGRLLSEWEWFLKAAKQGHADGMFRLGLHYFGKKQFKEALAWMRKAVDAGSTGAKVRIVEILAFANSGATLRDLETRGRKGDVTAMFNLARLYAYGWGVEPDRVKAYAWMLLSGGMDPSAAEYESYRKLSEDLLFKITADQRKQARAIADSFIKQKITAITGPIQGKIFQLFPQHGFTEIVIDLGASSGIKVGQKGTLKGLKMKFEVTEVFAENCKAHISADLGAIGPRRTVTIDRG